MRGRTIRKTILASCLAMSFQAYADYSGDVAGSRTITAQEIAAFADGYDPYGLSTLLGSQAGITVKTSGDLGAEDWLLIRGNGRDSSRMTLMLLDGRPYNSASNKTLEFNTIPLNLVESITIHYGPLASRYGGYTSVIDIKTKKISDVDNKASVYGGSLGTAGGSLTYSKSGDVSWLVNLDYHKTDGLEGEDFDIREIQTVFGPFGPEEQLVKSTHTYEDREYVQFVPTVKVSTDLNEKVGLEVLGQALLTTKQFGDGKSDLEVDQDAERERAFYNLGVSLVPAKKSTEDFNVTAYINYEAKETLVLDDELVNYGEQKKTAFGIQGYTVEHVIGDIWVRLGGSYETVTGSVDDDAMVTAIPNMMGGVDYVPVPTSESPNPYYAYEDELTTGSLFTEINYHTDSFKATLGYRRDAILGGEDADSPYMSLSANITDNLEVFASGGQSVRIPSLNEYNNAARPVQTVLYGLFQQIGIPQNILDGFDYVERPLQFEKQEGYQVGIKGSFLDNKLTAQLSAFNYDHEGYVFTDVVAAPVFIWGLPLSFLNSQMPPGSPPIGDELPVLYRSNKPTIDESKGWDLDVNYHHENLTAFVNVSKVEQETEYTDGRESHNTWFSGPDMTANAGVAYQFGDTSVDVRAQYRGDTDPALQERGNFPPVELDGATIFHLGVDHDFGNVGLSLDIHNITDEEYVTFYGLPMAGRHTTLTVSYDF